MEYIIEKERSWVMIEWMNEKVNEYMRQLDLEHNIEWNSLLLGYVEMNVLMNECECDTMCARHMDVPFNVG